VRDILTCLTVLLTCLLTAVSSLASLTHATSPQSCPSPRISQWASIRDSLWPLLAHHGGDQVWAHLEPGPLPGGSAAWCNPLQNDAAAIAAGRSLYRDNCASCHGDEGRGDGPGAAAADPGPSDFTRPEFAGMREPPGPALLYSIVARGIDGTTMRGFPDLSGWERLAIVAFVTQLPPREALAASRAWADSLRARRR
jgi:mono/diheme cytochrome c family protein